VRKPILFVHGDRDEFGSLENLNALYERVAENTDAELVAFQDCGHFFDDDLDALREAIASWVKKKIDLE
jgi:fermentation-respiration switch protein FrsA (DUF1100 family)